LLPPTINAVCAARRDERLCSFGAEHAEPGNMHTLAAVIEAPARRAESAIRSSWPGWLSRCVTIVCCGQGAGSASLQTRYGAGIASEPVKGEVPAGPGVLSAV
jgi:hypothetical protein